MGSRLVKYEFSPKENEQIEAVIKIQEETRSIIHGVVIDCRNRPIKDAVVKLLEVIPGNPCRMKPLTHTFTDGCGQFLFGPLYCNKKYALKVWYSDVKIKELIISPDCDHSDNEYNDSCKDDRHSDDDYSDGYCDINIDDYFDSNDDRHNENYDQHDYSKENNHHDRHSDDDNHIHYKGPRLYGQNCSKCKVGKINNFEDIEK